VNKELAADELPRLLFTNSSEGILIGAPDGRVVLANPAAHHIFGHPAGGLTALRITDLLPESTLAGTAVGNGENARPWDRSPCTGLRQDGSAIPLLVASGRIPHGEAHLHLLLVTRADAQGGRSPSESLPDHLPEVMNAAMHRLAHITDLEDGLDEILRTTLELGRTEKGIIQLLDPRTKCLLITKQEGFGPEFLAHFREVTADDGSVCAMALQAGRQIVVHDVEQEPDFSPHLHVAGIEGFRSVQSTPVFNSQGGAIGMVSTHSPEPGHFTPELLHRIELYIRAAEAFLERMRDRKALALINRVLEQTVSERTRQLADSLAREQELNRMKSAFVAFASHEFRTPLSSILTSATLAAKYGDADGDKQHRHLDRIKTSVRHLNAVLNEFLSVEKLESGRLEVEHRTVDLPAFVEDVITDLDGMRKPSQQVVHTLNGDGKAVLDDNILRHILLNLLSNAIKYSDKDVALNVRMQDGSLELEVKDRGIGIPIEQQEQVFSRFFRAGNVGGVQGTGLGLNLVKRYVDLLHGSIRFESRPGEGTTFTVQLPCRDGAA